MCLFLQILHHLFSLKNFLFCKSFLENHKYSIQQQFKSPILQKNFRTNLCNSKKTEAISKKGSKIVMKNVIRTRISKCTAVS
jgi:hypothetical protein